MSMSTLTFERPSCHDAFTSLFGTRRGIGTIHLDAPEPSRAGREHAQRILRSGLGQTFEALREHRADLSTPLLAQLLDETVETLCAEETAEHEGMLQDFFCSTVRDGRSDRILRVQLEAVSRPAPTPFRLHLWPEGGPDLSVHEHRKGHKKKVLTACGQDKGEAMHFQHSYVGAWAGEDPNPNHLYERCVRCAAYADEHPQEFPEIKGGLHDILPATDLAFLLSEHQRLVREKLLDRLTRGLKLDESWARKMTSVTLRSVMVNCALNYLLSDGPGNGRFAKMTSHHLSIEGNMERVGYKGRLVDVPDEDEWHNLLFHRRPPAVRRRRVSAWATYPPKPKPTLQGDWSRRREKLSEALWHIYKRYEDELRSGEHTTMHSHELAGDKSKLRKGRRRGRAALPGGRLAD